MPASVRWDGVISGAPGCEDLFFGRVVLGGIERAAERRIWIDKIDRGQDWRNSEENWRVFMWSMRWSVFHIGGQDGFGEEQTTAVLPQGWSCINTSKR